MCVCLCVLQSKAQRRQKENDITIRDVVYTSDIMRIRSAVIWAAFVWIASLVALINRCLDRILIGGTSCSFWQLSPPIKSCHKTHVFSSIASGLLLLPPPPFVSFSTSPSVDKMPSARLCLKLLSRICIFAIFSGLLCCVGAYKYINCQ